MGGNGTKKKKLAMPRDAHNSNLGVICLSIPSCPPDLLPHYLSFRLIPLIAIHPSNYDMGEYLCAQLMFKCLR